MSFILILLPVVYSGYFFILKSYKAMQYMPSILFTGVALGGALNLMRKGKILKIFSLLVLGFYSVIFVCVIILIITQ
jgi:hypothetical protein